MGEDKAKPVERPGRKATGLREAKAVDLRDSRVASNQQPGFLYKLTIVKLTKTLTKGGHVKRITFLFFSLILIFSGTVSAATYTFQPNPVDLFDLDHHKYYSWGIKGGVASGEVITKASLFFDNISNWDNNPNDLWVHLLDSPREGVLVRSDGQGGGNNLAGFGILLNHWQNLTTTSQDITYIFDDSEIGILNSYAADGVWGTGYDPDCHYWNDGVTITIETASVPIPTTILLFGSGLMGLIGLKRRFSK